MFPAPLTPMSGLEPVFLKQVLCTHTSGSPTKYKDAEGKRKTVPAQLPDGWLATGKLVLGCRLEPWPLGRSRLAY